MWALRPHEGITSWSTRQAPKPSVSCPLAVFLGYGATQVPSLQLVSHGLPVAPLHNSSSLFAIPFSRGKAKVQSRCSERGELADCRRPQGLCPYPVPQFACPKTQLWVCSGTGARCQHRYGQWGSGDLAAALNFRDTFSPTPGGAL